MDVYETKDVLVLAKRYKNTKRSYLLINPLQAKHLPTIPSKALKMMNCLGEKIAEKYASANLVIGFAETATAIAAVVSQYFGNECKFIHTTRESERGLSNWIYFSEEHSHAVEQKLFSGQLRRWISESPQIIFVDDEISTGKTLLNVIEQLRDAYPEARFKQFVAASIINRLAPEHEKRLLDSGIECEYLVKLDHTDFTKDVDLYHVRPAESLDIGEAKFEDDIICLKEPLPDPRFGVVISEYMAACKATAIQLSKQILKDLEANSEILVLGTEECMYPALILAEQIEKNNLNVSVRCHATTRSPIGVCDSAFYPIQTGYKIHSFYDEKRDTYIYNIAAYEMVIVFTDSVSDDIRARGDISVIFRMNGCKKVVFIEGGHCV